MKKEEFDFDDECQQFRLRQRIHRSHLIGSAVSATFILIFLLLFWH